MTILRTAMLLTYMSGSLIAQDVAWLKDVTTPPRIFALHDGGQFHPVDQDSDGKKISQWEDWLEHREQLRRHWLKFLGPMPHPRPKVQLEVLQSNEVDHVVRQLVRYEGEPDLPVEGYLLFPKDAEGSGKTFPAIIGLHQTTDASIDEIAGVSGPDAMQIGLKLAQRGYVVFCPRCFLWQNATSLNNAVEQHRKRHPQTLGMAKMLYDAMRGVDVLESLPFVDKTRIGSIGHSLGAKEVLYLMAFDDRVRAGVASEGGMALRSTNWNAPWYLGSAIDDESFPLNHHQLLAMIAPRPFLVLGGESGPGAADGDRSWVLIDAAMPVWRLSGHPVRIGLLNHNEGHSVSPLSFERMAEWLDVYVR
ncbi:MAG: dienelactone hydrolase family protein [Planctomyces sp.]|nr:dienelactone hydrolase family protein [Planctomyces sp.]